MDVDGGGAEGKFLFWALDTRWFGVVCSVGPLAPLVLIFWLSVVNPTAIFSVDLVRISGSSGFLGGTVSMLILS